MALTQVGTVFAPVTDQNASLRFYVSTLGWENRGDWPYGGGLRWVEVAPVGSTIAIALVPVDEGRAVTRDQTLCALASSDIEADHAALVEAGVLVDAEIGRAGTPRSGLTALDVTVTDPQPAQFFFRDPDGNRYLVVDAR
jgi:catechol 2,3-dioxygenase-like lactoylglutathione lyase family enzyme